MKTKLIIISILISLNCLAQNKMVEINGHIVEFKQLHVDSLSEDIVAIYRNNQKILTHTIRREDGDCSSEQLELGTYEVKGHQIIFYTYWVAADRQGFQMFPFGARKQIYDIDKSGKMKLTSATIYIEDDANQTKVAMLYLHKSPKNKQEENLLQHYIHSIESKYKSKFVTGKNKQILLQEVQKKLQQKITLETKNWTAIYGNHTNR